MSLAALFRRNRRRQEVIAAYHRIVAQARRPVFFAEWGVPDTLDGRFETLALHAFLVHERLRTDPDEGAAFAQDLFDTMFADLDRAMREMGASDIGVGRHVKAMARGFYGRSAAYGRGLAEDDAALADALRRNLFGTIAPTPDQLASAVRYIRGQAAALAAAPLSHLLAGDVPFVAEEAAPWRA